MYNQLRKFEEIIWFHTMEADQMKNTAIDLNFKIKKPHKQ